MDDVFEVRDDVTDEDLKQGKHLCALLNKDANALRLLRVFEKHFVVRLTTADGERQFGLLMGYYRKPQNGDFESVDDLNKRHWDGEPLPDGK